MVDSRESARRSASPLRDFKNEEGRGEASRGGGTQSEAEQTFCGRRWNSVEKESGRLPSAVKSGRRGDVSESKPMEDLAPTLTNRRKDLIKIKYSKSK
ncbi:unnamed protein product [Gulo gulo]|uniref:Uncharacterized protein n=1 Tax=Gulo gulo TaxID=48420 RepID=A0A9X9Q5Y6_GULGU|nr:unnamed protein product [Gulo gulo]